MPEHLNICTAAHVHIAVQVIHAALEFTPAGHFARKKKRCAEPKRGRGRAGNLIWARGEPFQS